MKYLPFGKDARSTLVYLVFAGCGPALTACVIWAMRIIRDWTGASDADRLDKFASLAMVIASALLVITVALAAFVSIRAIKVGKDGLEASSFGGDDVVRDGDTVIVNKDQP
jgi:hypothetical protein